MEFWDRMKTTLDKGVSSSRDLFDKARERARELGDKGVTRFEIMQLESEAEKLTAKLGTRAYEVLVHEGQSTISKNTPGVKDLVSQIGDVERRIKEKEETLRRQQQAEPE